MMKVKLNHNKRLDIIDIQIDGLKAGKIDRFDGNWCYFPVRTHEMTGEHFIAAGKVLSKINDDPCSICKNNGDQSWYPSGCTGCSSHPSVIDKNFSPVEVTQ